MGWGGFAVLPHGVFLFDEMRRGCLLSFKDALAKARESRPEPVIQQVELAGVLFGVEARRLDGMDWAGVMAECPPKDEAGALLGYDARLSALIACRKFGRLLGPDGEPVDDVDWEALFAEISGVEVQAIASIWWQLNVGDPNKRVVELKKASTGGVRTSSS